MFYDYKGDKIGKYAGIVGDGITDDTAAIQTLVNNYSIVELPESYRIRLTQSVAIDTDKIKLFDGGNSTFIVDGNFVAFNVSGSLVSGMSANPDTLNDKIKKSEAAFILKNCKIMGTGSTVASDGGVKLSGCFKTRVKDCYFTCLTDGIIVENVNRDLMFDGNEIYGMFRYGIHIKQSVNLHQFNIENNMISYCQYCIYLDNPDQIANWQCTGNDIEISTYPDISLQNQRCIRIASDNVKSGQLSEIEIVGNTIQGHSQSTDIIEINGGTNRYIQLISLCGNHISNANGGSGITLSKVNNMAINGNTFKSIANGTCVEVANTKNLSITGNTFDSVGSFATIDSQSQNVVVVANSGESTGAAITSGISGSGFAEGMNTITEEN